jgi:hypothetical protein
LKNKSPSPITNQRNAKGPNKKKNKLRDKCIKKTLGIRKRNTIQMNFII